MKKFKFSWIVELVLFFIGFYIVYHQFLDDGPVTSSDTVHTETKQSGSADKKLAQAVICIDIDEEHAQPLLPKSAFNKYIDYLYCFTKVTDANIRTVVHYWIFNDDLQEQLTAEIAPESRAGWTKHQMSSDKKGDWRVEIRTADGKLLGTVKFKLR